MTATTCCMVTQTGNPCSRRVEYEGMVCRQHGIMLAKQARVETEQEDDGFWDYGVRDRSADLEDDWGRVDDDVIELFGTDEPPSYDESQRAEESKRGRRERVVRFADECESLDLGCLKVTAEEETEKERCARLAQMAAAKGQGVDETQRIADTSGRWIWTVPKARGKSAPRGYFAQFQTDGRMAVRCECPGCAPKPKSKAKLCMRPVRTEGHCVKCTCVKCVCPARVMHGLESKRALTGWWDNPCGGKCDGCKRLAREHCAGAARGWKE
jgi:hypothetical protein